jgi:Putative metallopeptidase
MSNRMAYVCALAGILMVGAGPAVAQLQAPLSAAPAYKQQEAADILQWQARLDQAAHGLENNPGLKSLTHEQRKTLIEFVAGNMLFAMNHELGHALVSEMGLPVLGKEEDAVDAYAVLAMLSAANKVSDGVLAETISGWFLDSRRNAVEGTKVPFYDAHSVDARRAYDIICLMVGFDPDKFAAAATKAKMPADRQGTCEGDYSNAAWSWTTVLRPHLRPPGHPKQKIDVKYGSGKGQYDEIAQAFRTIGMLEIVAELAADRYVWRRPITIEVQTCGFPNADWDLGNHRILVCYEMAQDFADLYRGYGLGPAVQPAVATTPSGQPAARTTPAVQPAAKTK